VAFTPDLPRFVPGLITATLILFAAPAAMQPAVGTLYERPRECRLTFFLRNRWRAGGAPPPGAYDVYAPEPLCNKYSDDVTSRTAGGFLLQGNPWPTAKSAVATKLVARPRGSGTSATSR